VSVRRDLPITLDDLDYLADALRQGVLTSPVSAVRDRRDRSVVCEVLVAVSGLGDQSDRVATVLTSWHLRSEDEPPGEALAMIDVPFDQLELRWSARISWVDGMEA
jgi:hypothetical protein